MVQSCMFALSFSILIHMIVLYLQCCCVLFLEKIIVLEKIGGMRVSRPQHEKAEKEPKDAAAAIEDAAGFVCHLVLTYLFQLCALITFCMFVSFLVIQNRTHMRTYLCPVQSQR